MKEEATQPRPALPEREECPQCEGDGLVPRRLGLDWTPCPTCHGTGLMPTQADIDREAWEQQQADAARLEQTLAGDRWA